MILKLDWTFYVPSMDPIELGSVVNYFGTVRLTLCCL